MKVKVTLIEGGRWHEKDIPQEELAGIAEGDPTKYKAILYQSGRVFDVVLRDRKAQGKYDGDIWRHWPVDD